MRSPSTSSVVVVAFSLVHLFASPAFACPCSASEISAFNVSVDGIGLRATAKCCSVDIFHSAEVTVLRENGSDPSVDASYSNYGNCDELTLPLTELHCTYFIVCHSRRRTLGGQESPIVSVSLQDFISCNDPPSRAEINGLQHCPCVTDDVTTTVGNTEEAPTTTSDNSVQTPVSNKAQTPVSNKAQTPVSNEAQTPVSNKSPIISNDGHLIPVTTSVPLITLVIVATVVILIAVVLLVRRRNARNGHVGIRKLEAVQISREQQENTNLLSAQFRKDGKENAESIPCAASMEDNTFKRFQKTKDLAITNIPPPTTQNSAEPTSGNSTQCTNNVADICGVIFCTGKKVMSSTSSRANIISYTTGVPAKPVEGTEV